MENGVTRHVAGDILGEFFHDLLIDLLEERDISNEIVEKTVRLQHNIRT
jgi:hypothetical protein